MSRHRIREIHIVPVLNGFIVNVGCQRVVFESKAKLVGELQCYLHDPGAMEKAYIRDAVNPLEEAVIAENPVCQPQRPATGIGDITRAETEPSHIFGSGLGL